jgi:serine phosphatase RsbU (regulator of sigma subunit)
MGTDKPSLLVVSSSAVAETMRLQLVESQFPLVHIVPYSDAMREVRAELPDLILLTQDPGVSSLSLINKLNRQFPMIPIIMVAIDIDQENMREHLEAGASDYIYYVGAECELLPYVVQQNLDHVMKVAAVEAQEETVNLFEQLERDQRSGFRVQQAMLPSAPMAIRGLTFNHQLYPSMIMSGDFIDYFELSDGRVLFYIADVSGHGASSAFITVLLKSLSRRLLENPAEISSTAEVLSWINGEILQWDLEHHVTMFLAIIDEKNSMLQYSNAAHFPGTILCAEEGARFLEIGGKPLGLYNDPGFSTHELELPKYYCIVMFSDGVFEILPQSTLDDKEAHLLSVVKSHRQDGPEAMVDDLVDDLGVLTARSIPDDIAVFTVASRG